MNIHQFIFKKFCEEKGISLEYSLPNSPQMNGKSERMNRTIYNTARTILDESKLPRHLWGEAVLTATFLINRCPSKSINNQVPAKIFGRDSWMNKLRVFGCKGWAVIPPTGDKLDNRATPVRMVGYAKTGYKLWDPIKDRVITSRDVRFDETDTKYEKYKEVQKYYVYDDQGQQGENNIECNQKPEIRTEEQNIENYNISQRENTEETDKSYKDSEISSEDQEVITTRSGRKVNKAEGLKDFVTLTYEEFCLISSDDDPETYEDAMKNGWEQAIQIELNAHNRMNTWTETDLPENKKAIDGKWVFKTKENGMKKARLVARGYQIKQQGDFGSNYAPVARISTVRMALAQAVQNSWTIRQLDVPTAFLNGMLESEVYMKPPEGVETMKNKVLKLNRGLYGLRESPKCWNQRFDNYIQEKGFKRSQHDFCLYFGERNLWIVIYVDDIIVMGEYKNVKEVIQDLKREFHTKDFGEPKLFLGMELENKNGILKITQKRQINKMLEKFGMKDCKGASTPITKGYQVDPNEEIINNVPFRQIVGMLMFVSTMSRPDITYATSYLSQYLDKPTKSLWTQAKRTLRYLKETIDMGLVYKKSKVEHVETYSDADWAGNHKDRKSVSGSVTLYSGKAVSWFSRKQNCVALSTVEAEYIAAATSACDLLYTKGLFSDFTGLDINKEVKCMLLIDNCGAIQLTKSFTNSKKAKHIEIKYHFIKDLLDKKVINIDYIPTDKNLADLFTKSFSEDKLFLFRKYLNIL